MFDIVQIGMIQRWCLKYLRSIGQWLVMGIPVLCAVLVYYSTLYMGPVMHKYGAQTPNYNGIKIFIIFRLKQFS